MGARRTLYESLYFTSLSLAKGGRCRFPDKAFLLDYLRLESYFRFEAAGIFNTTSVQEVHLGGLKNESI